MPVFDLVRRLSGSLRREGLVCTARKLVSIAREPWFDIYHGTTTGGRVRTECSGASGPNIEHAVDYEPTSSAELRRILRRLQLPARNGVFVDFGCGKGRVLMLATEYCFDRIVGIEFAPPLCDIARMNVQKYSPDDERVEILNQDAVEYEFRDDETVIFFFNPFGETVMRAVVEKIGESLRRRPRPVWVIYSNPRCSSLFEASEHFTRVEEIWMPRTRVSLYRSTMQGNGLPRGGFDGAVETAATPEPSRHAG